MRWSPRSLLAPLRLLNLFCVVSFNQLLAGSAKNYLPPPPESRIELWVPKSTVDTQILEKHRKVISTIAFAGSAENLGAAVLVDSSDLPVLVRSLTCTGVEHGEC